MEIYIYNGKFDSLYRHTIKQIKGYTSQIK